MSIRLSLLFELYLAAVLQSFYCHLKLFQVSDYRCLTTNFPDIDFFAIFFPNFLQRIADKNQCLLASGNVKYLCSSREITLYINVNCDIQEGQIVFVINFSQM